MVKYPSQERPVAVWPVSSLCDLTRVRLLDVSSSDVLERSSESPKSPKRIPSDSPTVLRRAAPSSSMLVRLGSKVATRTVCSIATSADLPLGSAWIEIREVGVVLDTWALQPRERALRKCFSCDGGRCELRGRPLRAKARWPVRTIGRRGCQVYLT